MAFDNTAIKSLIIPIMNCCLWNRIAYATLIMLSVADGQVNEHHATKDYYADRLGSKEIILCCPFIIY